MHQLSVDLSAKRRIDHPTQTLYCDSQSTVHLIKNHVYHANRKHIEVRYHHIRELVTNKKLEVRKVDTKVNIANNVTKSLPDQRSNAVRGHIGLQQASDPRRPERKEKGKSKNNTARQVESCIPIIITSVVCLAH